MLKQVISQGDYVLWSQCAVVLFFLAFVGILFWVLRAGSASHYRYMARIPRDVEDSRMETRHE